MPARPAGEPIPRDEANRARPVVDVGTLNFPEQVLLGRLYAGALRAAGYRVRVRSDLGSEAAAVRALRRGKIDAFPGYLGSVLGRPVPRGRAAAYKRVREAFARRGVAALPPTPFEDAPGFAVRRSTARRLPGTRLSDLRGVARRLTLAGPPGCARREDCARGLRRVYGLRFRRVRDVPLARRHAILRGRGAHVGAVFTTDADLAHGDLVLLRDDRHLIPPYPVTLLVRDRTLDDAGRSLPTTIGLLQTTLTTPAMQRLNASLARGTPASRVASRHLRRTGLVR